MKALKYILLSAGVAVAAAGCTDISDYPDGRMEFEDIFQNPKLVGGYMNACYMGAVKEYNDYYGNKTFLASCCDEGHDVDDVTGGPMSQWNNGMISALSNPWDHTDEAADKARMKEWNYYGGIRNCNVMIDRVETATIRLASERESYRGEARGLRAFYYLELLRNYGAVPLVLDNSGEAEFDWSGAKKATYAEVTRRILRDCAEVIGYDPANFTHRWAGDEAIPANSVMTFVSGASDAAMHRWNKAMTAGVMSEAALYAASPLNNDGSLDWAEAAEICKFALDACLENGLALVNRQPEGDYAKTSYNAYDYFFLSSIDARGVNDTESIIYAKSRWNNWQYCGLPTTSGQSRAGSCPTQELVDCYETLDGQMPVLGYADDDHLQPIYNPAATTYDPANPYENRDPRLMATVYYHGVRMMPDPNLAEDKIKYIDITEDGNCALSSTSVRYTRTGYYIRKFSSPSSSRNGNNDGWARRMRLAELYLNYAEAANEAAAATAPNEAVDAVNAVRERVGMPKLPYGMGKDEFRTRVRNERRVELAYEGHRFYDVRRWNILDKTDKVVTGMSVDASGNFNRFVVQRRNAWSPKWLRLPIPNDEVARLFAQTGVNFQNPGWE